MLGNDKKTTEEKNARINPMAAGMIVGAAAGAMTAAALTHPQTREKISGAIKNAWKKGEHLKKTIARHTEEIREPVKAEIKKKVRA